MPTYQYRCEHCEHTLQLFQSMSDEPVYHCPACKRETLVRVITGGIGVIFKGSGFYVNDSKQSTQQASSTKQKGSDSVGDGGEAATQEATPDSKEASSTKETAPASAQSSDTPASSPSTDSQRAVPVPAGADAGGSAKS